MRAATLTELLTRTRREGAEAAIAIFQRRADYHRASEAAYMQEDREVSLMFASAAADFEVMIERAKRELGISDEAADGTR